MVDASANTATTRPLTRERVLRVAMRLADAGGSDALSMRKLADELGVTPMALYNHVANKDDLLTGLRDLVLEEIDFPDADVDWRTAMRDTALSAHAALRRHPWAAPIWLRQPPTPTLFRYMEARLACLRRAGFPTETAYTAYHFLDNYVISYTSQQLSFAATFPTWHEGGARHVANAALAMLPVDEFPFLVEHIRLHLEDTSHSHGDDFEFGLDLILESLDRILSKF